MIDATRESQQAIGKSADNMYSYLALVQDDRRAGGQHGAGKPTYEH
ncbi:hypothetical protein LAD77_02165 [Klebsiella pneumoniae]|nr:hypothetical protein [Klebsiella pneumoniae]